MRYIIKNYLPFIFLALCAIPLFFLNIHNGHSPGGDDYAQYIKEGQNIATGKPYYQSNYVFNKYNNCYSPPQYPPGFPLLLAPVIKIWGIAIKPMCYFNSVIAACILICFFIYFRRYMGATAAVLLSIIISYSGFLLDLKQVVLADEPSLLFVMLYLIFRNATAFNWKRVALLSCFSAMAILIRTQSILLLFAEVAYLGLLIVKKRDWKLMYTLPSLPIVAGSLLLTVLVNKIIFYCPTSASGFYVDFLKITLQKGLPSIIRDNAGALLESIKTCFHYDTDNGIRSVMVEVMESCGVALCISGFILSVRKRLSIEDIFFVLVCGMILYYPIHDTRYFLPVVAIVFLYCYRSLEKIIPAITGIRLRYAAILLTAMYLFTGARYFKNTTKQPFGYVPAHADSIAFAYLEQYVSDSDLIICARPRMVTLYTNRRCVIHAWQWPMAKNKEIFDSMHAKYLLLVSGFVDDYYHTYLQQYQHPQDSALIAPGYMLYRLR